MLTTISLMTLLLVVALGVRLQSLATERTTVEWPLAPSLYVSAEEPAQNSIAQYEADFSAYKLPDFSTELGKTKIAASSSRIPRQARPKFQKIDKEINILEEVFAPGHIQDEVEDGQWKAIQGSIELPKELDLEISKVEASEVASSSLVALMDTLVLPTETIVADAPVVPIPAKAEVTPIQAAPKSEDKVTTTQASTTEVDAEPEFFEYEKEAPIAVAQEVPGADYSPQQAKQGPEEQSMTTQVMSESEEDLETYSYTVPALSLPAKKQTAAVNTQEKMPSPKTVSTQAPGAVKEEVSTHEAAKPEQRVGFVAAQNASTKVSALSVDGALSEIRNFELRAHDDSAQIIKDNGSGAALISESVIGESGARSFELIHRDHVPTHADVPVVAGNVELEIPVFTKDFLSKHAVSPRQKPLGFFLAELDDETESVHLDGLKNSQKFFTADFKLTSAGDHRYVLVAGVEVGNRLVTYKRGDGKFSQKIVHIYEEEVTFDPNLYAQAGDIVLNLFEEDLLSRSRRELSISGEQVELTFSGVKAEKLSTASYRLRTPPLLLGSRHYITLGHQNEEIFLGVDKSKDVDVPSEPLIREVIRKFGIQGNSSACLVQINLDGAIKRYEVLAESHGQGHVSYGLALDDDGQFYESLGENSRRLFVMSENQGGDSSSDNAKINVRLEYQDGSKRNFSTFCSPNTYLVEQL